MYIKFTIVKTMNPYSVIDQQKNHGAPYIVNLLLLNCPHVTQIRITHQTCTVCINALPC